MSDVSEYEKHHRRLPAAAIAVGLPVTHQLPAQIPACGLRLLVPSSWAPGSSGILASAIRLDQRSNHSRLGPSYDPWLFYPKMQQEITEPLPIETAPLAAPIQPLEQNPH
jgi:hypothetical protein